MNKYLFVLLLLFLLLAGQKSYALDKEGNKNSEFSLGYSMMVYQSVYSMIDGLGFEFVYGKSLSDQLKWENGLRLGLNPGRPEGFTRILAGQTYGKWAPSVGLEFGLTGRATFRDHTNLLRETKEAMRKELGIAYVSTHAELLSFNLNEEWNLSMLGIDLGTHVNHFGRTLRFQVQFFTIGLTF